MMSSSSALEQGWQYFHHGDLAQADHVASQILDGNRHDAEGWFLRGVVHQVAGNFPTAQQAYEQALALRPEYPDAINNLGVLYSATGKHDAAFAVRARFLQLLPNSPIAHGNYADSLAQFGRIDEAAKHFRHALSLNPEYLDALINFAAALARNSHFEDAVPLLQRALALRLGPADAHNAHNILGLAHLNLNRQDLAELHLGEALRLNPHSYEALVNLGAAHARVGRFELALEYLQRALQLRPDGIQALENCGTVLHDLRRSDEAVACFERAIALQPNSMSVRSNFGKMLTDLCRFEEAQTHLREAIRLSPNFADAHNNLGLAQFHLGDDAASEASFGEAIRLVPEHNRARLNRGLIWLRRGEFARAWSDYELRFDVRDVRSIGDAIPRWDGSDFPGRTLLVRCEQGLGDVLQFLRFMPLVKANGGRTVVEVPASLLPIVSRCPGVDEFVATGSSLPQADIQVPLLSLPSVLGTIDAPEPHIFADPALVVSWAAKLKSLDGVRVGIAWQGDATFRFDRARSIPLAEFEPLAKIPGVRLVSLQKHGGTEQIAENAARVPLVDFGDELDGEHGAFIDTAAIMKNLDLVITSDSAVAHLAGGLGVTVWLAVPFAPDWRWFENREDSPWYPTMRLFRQSKNRAKDHAWGDVFQRIAAALSDVVARRPCLDAGSPDAGLPVETLLVPTSPGELLDKISILRIKVERLGNPRQVENVQTELTALEQQRAHLLADRADIDEFLRQLKDVNETLWQVEEDLRQCEKEQCFDERFIELARSVYKHNDHRAALKRRINTQLGSALIEEKTHDLPEPWPMIAADAFEQIPRS